MWPLPEEPGKAPAQTPVRRGSFRGVVAAESMFIDCIKECVFVGECHGHCYSLPGAAMMTSLMGPQTTERGSQWGPSKLWTPHPQALSRPVAVANVAILCGCTKARKSQLSRQRVTMSALGSGRVNRVLPSDLWLIPRSSRQNRRPRLLDMHVSRRKTEGDTFCPRLL